MQETDPAWTLDILPFIESTFGSSFKYLGFSLKLDSYQKQDWWWLVSKTEKGLTFGATCGYLERGV